VVIQSLTVVASQCYTDLIHRRLYNTPVQANPERLLQLAVIINSGSRELL